MNPNILRALEAVAAAVVAVEADAAAFAATEVETVVTAGTEVGAREGTEVGLGAEVVLLSESDAALALAYPPGFHLFRDEHARIYTCPRHFNVHGIYDDRSLPTSMQNPIDKHEVENFEFDAALLGRLFRLIPQIGDLDSEDLMKREMIRHGANVTFLTTVADYANFALDVYNRYQFAGLSDFIVETATSEGIGERVVEVDLPWIGVRVRDLLRIENSFPPIQAVNGQVNLVLIERSGGRLFLYEITFCVTREELPGRRTRQVEVYIKKQKRKNKTPISPDSYVFLLG